LNIETESKQLIWEVIGRQLKKKCIEEIKRRYTLESNISDLQKQFFVGRIQHLIEGQKLNDELGHDWHHRKANIHSKNYIISKNNNK
jgi:hypothetical protein